MNIAYITIILSTILCISITQAPVANPYDYHNIDTYNCLDIALDCQSWHEFNGINTTVVIGLFNASMGHAWLINTDTGENITGYVPEWDYMEVIYGAECK